MADGMVDAAAQNRLNLAPLYILARGFAFTAWGVMITALTFSTRACLALNVLNMRLPAYIVGSFLTGWGALCLCEHQELRAGDLRAPRILLALVAVQLYMAPFIIWHQSWPLEPFFQGNFMALMVVLLLTMLLIDLTAAQALYDLRQPAAGRWALGLAGLVAVGALALPAWSAWRILSNGDDTPLRFFETVQMRFWLLVPPAILTMSLCLVSQTAAMTRMMED